MKSRTVASKPGPAGGSPRRASAAIQKRRAPDAEALEAWLVNAIAQKLEVAPREIGVNQEFKGFGLGSVAAIELVADLEKFIGQELPTTLLWDFPTIHSLAEHLAGRS